MTPAGVRQAYILGLYFRKRYLNDNTTFLNPALVDEQLVTTTSNVGRNRVTSEAVLQSMIGHLDIPKLNHR